MSWCIMQESIVGLKNDIEVIFERTGGRTTDGEKPEPFITMSQCQVMYISVTECLTQTAAAAAAATIGVDPSRVQGSEPSQKLYCEGPQCIGPS